LIGLHDVGHHPGALVELHVGEHVGAAPVGAFAAVVNGVAVDGPPAGDLQPAGAQAGALRADGARVPDEALAVVALLYQEPSLRCRVPERLGLRVDRRHGGGQLHCVVRYSGRGHASSRPRMRVAAADLVPSEPPLPCARASSQSGTWTAGLASPRSWRTASITF